MPWSRNTLWRQGSILLQKDFHTANLNDSSDAELVVAISHDCDIANDNLEAEPAIEFIFGRIIQKLDGNYTHGKNPRILHLNYIHSGTPISLELIASRRIIVDKHVLEAVHPDQTYELVGSRQILQGWPQDTVAMPFQIDSSRDFVKFPNTFRIKARKIPWE
jgi:hypothetical protein